MKCSFLNIQALRCPLFIFLMTNGACACLYSCYHHFILVAALTCCRTDEELNEVLVPELAHKFTACADNVFVSTPGLVLFFLKFGSSVH
jgi:hypothetical protein